MWWKKDLVCSGNSKASASQNLIVRINLCSNCLSESPRAMIKTLDVAWSIHPPTHPPTHSLSQRPGSLPCVRPVFGLLACAARLCAWTLAGSHSRGGFDSAHAGTWVVCLALSVFGLQSEWGESRKKEERGEGWEAVMGVFFWGGWGLLFWFGIVFLHAWLTMEERNRQDCRHASGRSPLACCCLHGHSVLQSRGLWKLPEASATDQHPEK